MEIIRLIVEPITTPDFPDATPVAHHVQMGRRTTTVHLEAATWNALCVIACEQGVPVDQLCADIAEVIAPDASFAEGARCYVFGHIVQQIPDEFLPAELRDFRRQVYRRTIQ